MNAAVRLAAWILAVVLVTLPIVAVLNGWIAAERWPMHRLQVTGEFQHVADSAIREAVLPHVGGGFFAVRLGDVRSAVAALPWVKEVEVRKRWPDLLEVAVVEHRAFARWGGERLLSDRGELFEVAPGSMPAGLPELEGPDTQVGEVVALYQQSIERFRNSGARVRGVSLSARGGWDIALTDGTQVVLGRSDPERRLARFARLLPQLRAAEERVLVRADLRYTNGFALVWAEPEAGATPGASVTNIAGHPRT
jgi:cell division protein FtsQ